MASTNKTTHYDLSQYVGSDKPTYLGDYNTDMSKIDTAINSAQTKADSADLAATSAQTTAENAQTTANTAVTNAATAQTTADGNTAKIGTLANLNTSTKTDLVSAINEANDKIETTKSNSNVKSYACSYVNEALKEYVKDNTEYKTNKVYIDSNNVEHTIYSKWIIVNSPSTINSLYKLTTISNLNKVIDFNYSVNQSLIHRYFDRPNQVEVAIVTESFSDSGTNFVKGDIASAVSDPGWTNIEIELYVEYTKTTD